jgi:hypothetical protein
MYGKTPSVRRQWGFLLLLVGALTFLVSLYLPWQRASCDTDCLRGQGADAALRNLFGEDLTVDGWSSGVGEAAALLALILAAVAVVALARPKLADRLPLGVCALMVGYFGFAVAAETGSVAERSEIGRDGFDLHYAYGAYLGVAAAVVVLLAAAALRRSQVVRHNTVFELALLAFPVVVLLAFLLPWGRLSSPPPITVLGIASPAAVVAAVLTLCLLGVSRRTVDARRERLLLAGTVALFTGAAFSSLPFPAERAYGAWLGLGAAAASLIALVLMDGGRLPRPKLPRWSALATCGASALLVASLFAPWQKACYESASDLGPLSGRCVSTNGWTSPLGVAAAVLALGLVIVTLSPPHFPVSVTALAAAIGVLVATLGFQLEDRTGDGFRLELGYGSTIGFASAGLLLAFAMARFRRPVLDWNRVLIRLVPIAACAAYLLVVVLPWWWDVLPPDWQFALRLEPLSWLTVAGVLFAIWLLWLWTQRITNPRASVDLLVLLPLALLALAALDLARLRADGVTWGRGAVVALALLLTVLGRIERREGLENLRVPEILRVDRIGPPPET